MMVLKSILYTITVVVIAIALIATLYVSIWLILAVGVILLFYGFYNTLIAKKHLLDKSNEL